MDANKRNFLTAMIPVGIGMPLALLSVARFAGAQKPTPPGAAQQGSIPPHPAMPEPDTQPRSNPKDILKQNQQQIHDDVEKLYKLASELKEEVEKTDATNTLSL